MEGNMVVREPKTFHFNFDLPKTFNKSLKHETEFIVKRNEYLTEDKIKTKISQLLSRYKHGNDIYEYREQ